MTWSIQSPRLSSSTSSLAENRAETPPFCLCLGYIPPGEPWVMESPTVATPSMWTFSFPPSSASAAGAGTRFTLPFVRWAELCQGRVGTVAQLPQPPSPPPLLVFPQAGMQRAARAVASEHQRDGASLLERARTDGQT